MSLANKRVVITRAPHQAAELAALLREKSAVPVLYPCIDIAPPTDTAHLDAALRNLHAYKWLILTSANTVLALHRRSTALQLSPNWNALRIGVVGPKTAQAVREILAVTPSLVPAEHTAAALAQALPVAEGTRILLPQSEIAEDTLQTLLTAAGADVTQIVAYRNVIGQGGEDVPQMLADGRIDALTFTSSSTATNFVERVQQTPDLPVACIGPVTAQTALEIGFTKRIVPQTYTLDAMIDALEKHFEN